MVTGRPSTSGLSTVPYRLHGLLREHGIPLQELRLSLKYARGVNAGQALAPSTMSHLLLRREWVGTLDVAETKDTTAVFLRKRGVPEADIDTAWEPAGELPAGTPVEKIHRSFMVRADGNNAGSTGSTHPDEDPFVLPETEMLSAAAREHFHVTRHPFQDDIQGPQDVYLSKDQRYIRESMYQAAKHSGFLAVVGESGSGKSTLRRDLLDRIRRDNEPIVVIQPQTIDKKALTAAHICDAIIADLSTEKARVSLESKGRQVQRILSSSARTGNAHVLLIEEAHDLSLSTLKYLKRFWELEDGFKKLIGIVLVGQPELGERLDERRNYEAREVIRRCEVARLKPLNGNLEEYLALKFKRVNLKLDDVLEKNAFDAMRTRLSRQRHGTSEVESHLYPLVVQNLLVKCMNQAVELGMAKVNADLIGRV